MTNDPSHLERQPGSRSPEPTDLQKQPNSQMPGAAYQPPPLGNLAQGEPSKRGNPAPSTGEIYLKQAKLTLLFVGIMTTLINGYLLINLPSEVEKARMGFFVLRRTPTVKAAEDEMYRLGYFLHGGPLLMGIVLIVLGLVVRTGPLACTIAGLTVFLFAQIGIAYVDPFDLARWFLLKIILVIVLLTAINAAFAHEKERIRATAIMENMPNK